MMKEAQRLFLLSPPVDPLPAALGFLRQARFRLREDYLNKINGALSSLSEQEIWWRPNQHSNSIGNLILHLSGNIRQWMIAGVGGATDTRDRSAEFAERRPKEKDALLQMLSDTLAEVDVVLATLEAEVATAKSDAPLQKVCVPQGFSQTVLDAVFHVVEHFSYHTGQIVFIAKLQQPESIRFYDDRQLQVER